MSRLSDRIQKTTYIYIYFYNNRVPLQIVSGIFPSYFKKSIVCTNFKNQVTNNLLTFLIAL